MQILSQIDRSRTPEHIAIIMDGNGRWAQKQGHMRLYGHNFGVEAVREALKGSIELNVKYLTLYAFSTENWNRPKEEVDGLMDLLVRSLSKEVRELSSNGVRLKTIGDISALPTACQDELKDSIALTKDNDTITLILALNYSSRWEIIKAMRELLQEVNTSEEVTIDTFEKHLTTSGIPDPELLIRTSGERRISNFLLWQIAYSEFHFTEVLWPDFKQDDLYKAVLDYQSRERRFGLLPEQLQ